MKSDQVRRLRPLPAENTCSYSFSVRGAFGAAESANKVGRVMLHYAVVFLVIALIAALFGFGGIAAGAAGIAKILFVIFLIGAVVAFLMNGRSTRI